MANNNNPANRPMSLQDRIERLLNEHPEKPQPRHTDRLLNRAGSFILVEAKFTVEWGNCPFKIGTVALASDATRPAFYWVEDMTYSERTYRFMVPTIVGNYYGATIRPIDQFNKDAVLHTASSAQGMDNSVAMNQLTLAAVPVVSDAIPLL